MIEACLRKGKNLQGYYDKGLIDTRYLNFYHEAIVDEMRLRGYNHISPLKVKVECNHQGHIEIDRNERELSERCDDCRVRLRGV